MAKSAAARRARILRRDGYICVYCGVRFVEAELTLDHVQPKMRGGDDSEGNLVTCCSACNAAKGHQAAWSYLSTRPVERRNFLEAVERSDAAHAQPVWPRHVRSILEGVR